MFTLRDPLNGLITEPEFLSRLREIETARNRITQCLQLLWCPSVHFINSRNFSATASMTCICRSAFDCVSLRLAIRRG